MKKITYLIMFLLMLSTGYAQTTSHWGRTFKNAAGVVRSELNIDLYTAGTTTKVYDMHESASLPGYYYFDTISTGDYDVYINGVKTYSNVWIGTKKLTSMEQYFSSDGRIIVETGIPDSTIPLHKFTTAAYNFIGSGGSVTNNPDDRTIINAGGNTLGVNEAWLDTTGTLWKLYGTPDSSGINNVGIYEHVNNNNIYNVIDYGAKTDGSTDSYTAIQACIDSAKSAGGGEVRLLDNHKYSQTLEVPSGVSLVGESQKYLDTFGGWQSQYIEPNLIFTGDSCAIRVTYDSDSRYQHGTTIKNINLVYDGSSVNTDGIQVVRASVNFENVSVVDFTGDGFDFGICWFSTANTIRATYCDSAGIRLYNSTAVDPTGQIVFINPTTTHCGIGFYAGNALLFEVLGGTIALADSYQVLLEGVNNAAFRDVLIEPELGNDRTHWGDLVFIDSLKLGTSEIKSRNILFENCSFYAGNTGTQPKYQTGIRIQNSINVRLLNNSFKDFTVDAIEIAHDHIVGKGIEIGYQYFYNCTNKINMGASVEGKYYDVDNSRWIFLREEVYMQSAVLELSGSYWYPLRFGTWRVWTDANGNMRIKSGAPSADTEGTVIGGSRRSGSASPIGSVTPRYVGEDYLNTSGPTWYKSYGVGNTNWVALN